MATPLQDITMRKPKVLDVETYINYFLISFKCIETGRYREFELYDGKPLDKARVSKIMQSNLTVSFNGLGYDLAMITAALRGYDNEQLKQLSDRLITSGKPAWLVCKEHRIYVPTRWDHIDLINVAPGQASLKIYGGRLHSKKLQDLPIEPSAVITPEQRDGLRFYCRNDLDTTEDLFYDLTKQLKLRVDMSDQYGVDLRSKSDAQIAEAVLKSELESIGVDVRKNIVAPGTQFRYEFPSFIKFESDTLKEVKCTVENAVFTVADSGQVKLPKELNKAIEFDGSKYKFGIGGLHSQEKNQVVVCGDDECLYEADFASYYPFIILGEKFYPKHLGPDFLKTYGDIVSRRIAAKKSGDKTTADSLKITINGSFGKLGSKYSTLYSPSLLIQTTITGQLCLFMLIEAVTKVGAKVVSANTDGIVIYCKKDQYEDVSEKLFNFELLSGYNLEETFYDAIMSRDVNSYVAIKKGGGVKGKGAYAEPNLMKNPTAEICVIAVKEYLADGVAIDDTIKSCDDIRCFVCIRSVTGGAIWRDQYLGKAVRFYYSTDGETIHYKKNGNKVPKSDGAKPLMELCESLPDDLDLQWYINEAINLLNDLGVKYHA